MQPEVLKTHTRSVNINRNGYLYVYLSNQSNLDVFFDNLQVVHSRGPLLEETHYYPFGLTMAGISSKAAGKLENRFKYNSGTERNTDIDINLDETDFRLYDAQIGRFHQLDALSFILSDMSPYSYAENNPILLNDPYGLVSEQPKTTLPEVVVHSVRRTSKTTKPLPTPKVIHAGAMPLPINPPVLTPVTHSTPVVNMPQPKSSPLVEKAPAAGRLFGLIGAILYPTPLANEPIPYSIPNPLFQPGQPKSKPDENGYITLYRGVNATHPHFVDALRGMAVPLGLDDGHIDPNRHNNGDTRSIFTSWSMSPDVAARFAMNDKLRPYGVILVKRFKLGQAIPSPDRFNEHELLIPGIVTGAQVHQQTIRKWR